MNPLLAAEDDMSRTHCRTRALRPLHAGFTLFEVAASLFIVSAGVLAVVMIFPVGLKQLQEQRFRTYAACIANQLIDVYAHADSSSVMSDAEAPGPWDIPIDRRVNAPDLEMRCSNQRYGLMPLPIDIARRLDSPGDEIQRILDEGGYIYYVMPNVPNAWREDLISVEPPNDLQKLLVGVVGPAQHNAAYSFPMKRWPYYGTVPGPPLHAVHNKNVGWDRTRPGDTGVNINSMVGNGVKINDLLFIRPGLKSWIAPCRTAYSWQACVKPSQELKLLGAAYQDYALANFTPKIDADKKAKLGKYLETAFNYAAYAGFDVGSLAQFWDGEPMDPLMGYPFDGEAPDKVAEKVMALNYLSSALMCLTRWHDMDVTQDDKSEYVVKGDPTLDNGVDIKDYYKVTPILRPPVITHNRIVRLVRNTRYVYYRFTAQNPYNWAVPRPIERATMMDYALMEVDMFRDPTRGSIWSGNASGLGLTAFQWKYVFPTPVTTMEGDANAPLGVSLTYPLGRIPVDESSANSFVAENGPASGRVSHATILNQFSPSERCRQLVFWAADWQSYQDCETAPSAPLDASRYPKVAPGGLKPVSPGSDGRGWDTAGKLVPTATFDDLMWGFTDGWGDASNNQFSRTHVRRILLGSYVHAYRNPEKNLIFKSSVEKLPTRADVSRLKFYDQTENEEAESLERYNPPDYGPPRAALVNQVEAPEVFSGHFGADRNGNNVLDRGQTPPSVRMRASVISRYNYYDMRVSCQFK